MFVTRYYMHFVNMLFIAAALYLGVDACYKFLISHMDYEEFPPDDVQVSAERSSEPVFRPLSNYKDIEERNLFRTRDAEDAEKQAEQAPAVEDLKETELKLKLWGTVTGDPDRAYAVIEESKQRKQDLYHIGDTVEGAVVKQILREKIIISFNGKDETLSMENPSKSVAKGPDQPSPSAAPPAPAFPFPGIGSAEGAPGDSRRITLERGQINDAINDVNNLMKQAKIRPHFKDGQPDGLTLSRIQRDSIFTQLGLRSGDIITGVDGQKIQSVDDALKFYNSLKSASNVSIEIKRRGKTEQLEYNIE